MHLLKICMGCEIVYWIGDPDPFFNCKLQIRMRIRAETIGSETLLSGEALTMMDSLTTPALHGDFDQGVKEDSVPRREDDHPGLKGTHLHSPYYKPVLQQEPGLSGANGSKEGRWLQVGSRKVNICPVFL